METLTVGLAIKIFLVLSLLIIVFREIYKYIERKNPKPKKIKFPIYRDGEYINVHQLKDKELISQRDKALNFENDDDKLLLEELEEEMRQRHIKFQ